MADEALPVPVSPRLPVPAALQEPLQRLRTNPLLARFGWPIAATGIAALALGGWLMLHQPARSPIFAQLPDADKAAVVSALETAGLSVALDPRTGAVLLPERDHARARMLLAAQGLPKAAPGGAELMAEMPLGTSRALEAARLKTAEERDLAAAIESLDGVQAARVLVARPEPSPFLRDRAPVTASVTLTLAPGRALSDSQARAIVHLVAGAVPGLSPDNVAITDQAGRMLAGEPGAGRMLADDRRLKLQAEMEGRARQSILELLGPVVGIDNITAQVSIDLDFAAREAAEEAKRIYGDTIPSYTEYKKVMAFKTQVASVNHYPAGNTVGYDRTFTLKRDSLLANLPMGYSDGYRRAMSNKAYVLIHGQKAPVVGKTSMNTTMVDVTDIKGIKPGDEVVLFGRQGDAEVKQSDLEEYNGALLADMYTVWGYTNPKKIKR